MAAIRFYYNDTISDFLVRSTNEVVGLLAQASVNDINPESTNAWVDEIEIMRSALMPYSGRGSVYFEYNIPRMGKRVDVIALIDNVVFVIEFKTENTDKFSIEAKRQVWDYALDLKNFQEGSLNRTIIPILVASRAPSKKCEFELKPFEDNVYQPLFSNALRLRECISTIIEALKPVQRFEQEDDIRWAKSGYSPTPTIIEAAIALYNHHTVDDITKHDADLTQTFACINRIIDHCRSNHRKAICFVTGVPGAGKTLIGLQTAIDQFNAGGKAIYLSGNFPLVEVLQEALARDYVKNDQIRYNRELKQGLTPERRCTKKEARSKVKAFIQMVHHYRDTYLEGTHVVDGHIVPIDGYFESHTDKAFVPVDNVAIFDEAQRAWTKEELVRFMKEKKRYPDFPYSEPEYLISCMDRRQDWGVVICLIGGGQEINKGEAGIKEWIESLNRGFKHWEVYISDHLTEKEYAQGMSLDMLDPSIERHLEPELHLKVSMRSFRAEQLSTFVHQVLELKPEQASETLKSLTKYPIVLTRSLDTAKKWLKAHARGSERMGLLASSKAERLKAISINVRYQPDFVHWFLEDDTDIRSSNCLEDTLTEFKVQGLEIDWACVAWDADLRLSKDHQHWLHYQLRSGTKWQNINKRINQEYQVNAYRVLLTRARQGMVILIPNGDNGVPPDETRKPEWYDGIYNYLKDIGIPEIEELPIN